MSVATKLQIKNGMSVAVLNAPADVDLELPPGCSLTDDAGTAYAVVLFVTTKAELHDRAAPVAEAARDDRLAWVAYPKARQRGTDLNRDLLWEEMTGYAVRPVRQVSVDDTWSALRFRPA